MTQIPPHSPPRAQPWRRRMVARDRNEAHRSSTPLELLFDLCFVAAVAGVGVQLHHGLAEGEVGPAVLGYLLVFFAIWWAWMNFTWFASAYDTDDVPYRLLTLLQIAGGLVIAAGVPAAFRAYDFTTIVLGYVLMRIAMLAQWLRAAREHPAGRPVALRYAGGIAFCQLGWLARLALPAPWTGIAFGGLGLLELIVPAWAERSGTPTPWHPGHIAERYGLFTMIVLGECVVASTTATQAAMAESGVSAPLVATAAGGLLLLFGMWWSYFKHPGTVRMSLRSAFLWGYGHFAVFAAVAALGAGLQVAAETIQGATHLSPVGAALTVAIPGTIYLIVLAFLHSRLDHERPLAWRLILLTSLLLLLTAASASFLPLGLAILLMGILVALLVAWHVMDAHRETAEKLAAYD